MGNEVKRKLQLIEVIIFTFLILMRSSVSVLAEEETELRLYARSAILVDAATGRILYEENGHEVMPMASTTKIMTCILAIESGKLEEYVTVSANADGQPKVRLGLKEGERYKLKDLLYSLMLESHNDTAVAVAEFVSGSVEKFADEMNAKAESLGCEDTFFVTPNGLDATKNGKVHSSTAYDMALIASYALENEIFRTIIGTGQYTFWEADQKKQYTVYNKDSFLTMYDGAIGVKTGFTNDAGYCFVGAVEEGNARFVSVVLACGWPPNKSWKWADTKVLMDYGTQNYVYKTFISDAEYESITVERGVENKVDLCVKREEIGLLLGAEEEITVEYTLEKSIMAPVEQGMIVGYEKYVLEGEILAEYPIVTAESVDCITFWYIFGKIMQNFMI